MSKINKWAAAFAQYVDFIVVYIAEAHASDGWPLGHFVDIPNHTCIADRKQASALMRSKYGLEPSVPVFLDTMDNEFDKEFAVWPERYYVSIRGVLQFVAMPNHEFGYDRSQFRNALDNTSFILASEALAKKTELEKSEAETNQTSVNTNA